MNAIILAAGKSNRFAPFTYEKPKRLYKGSVGDDDSFFFLPAYRNLVRFIDPALENYGLSIINN